jgi:hypothetical protein
VNVDDTVRELEEALDEFDYRRVTELCRVFAADLVLHPDESSPRVGAKVLSLLKANRRFDDMVAVGPALVRVFPRHGRIRRLYAQSLIETGGLEEALNLLTEVLGDREVSPGEIEEAWGLVGRIYKQSYVNEGGGTTEDFSPLQVAVDAYSRVWADSRNPWHGINVVALLVRGARDQVPLRTDFDPEDVARELLQGVEERVDDSKADVYDLAIALEAALALGKSDEAIQWAEQYVEVGLATGRDEFEFASTLRQLREVWALEPDDPVGSAVIPLLEAAMLDRGLRAPEGSGSIQLDAAGVAQMGSPEAFARLQRVFGDDAFKTVRWVKLLFERLQAIGSVAKRAGRAFGTGFVVRGPALSPDLEDDWYFVTNSHVVTNDEDLIERAPLQNKPSRPEEVVITFELLFDENPQEFGVAEVVFTSPPEELDVTILKLDRPFYQDRVEPYPIAAHLEDPRNHPRLYIAGHPGGGSLQVSMHDNHLLEFNEERMLYRTPTNPGSSGSPVFNDQWDLVGLHHAGSSEMPPLSGVGEPVEANRGIRVAAILAGLNAYLAERREVGG